MTIALVACLLLSLGATLFFITVSPRFTPHQGSVHLSTRAFAAWLMATCMFGSYFYTLQVPGLPDLSIERALFVICLVLAGLRVLRRDLSRGQNKLLELLMAAFSLACIISMSVHGFSEIFVAFARPSFVFLNGYLIPFIAFVLAKYFLNSDEDLLSLFTMFFLFGCYLAFIAYLEHFDLKSAVFPSFIVDAQLSTLHLDRSRGPFLNAAFNGLALNVAFLCGLMVLPSVEKKPKRFLYMALLALYLPAIYFTRTRSVYLHFLVTLFALVFVYQTRLVRWKILPVVLLTVCLALAANMGRITSASREEGGIAQMKEIYIRFGLADKSLALLKEHFFEGIGLAQFRTTSLFTPDEVEFQHNHLIGMAVELGVFGVSLYMAILAVIFWRLYHLLEFIPVQGFLNPNLVLLLAVALFVNLINNVFVEPTLTLFTGVNFFMFAGIVDNLYSRFAPRQR